MSQRDDVDELLTGLRREHRHLGVRELLDAKTLAEGPLWDAWTLQERAAALASLLARDRQTWHAIHVTVEAFTPGPAKVTYTVGVSRHRPSAKVAIVYLAVALLALASPDATTPDTTIASPITITPGTTAAPVITTAPTPGPRLPLREAEAALVLTKTATQRSLPWRALLLATLFGLVGVSAIFALRDRRRFIAQAADADHQERAFLDRDNRDRGQLFKVERHPPFDLADIDDVAAQLARRETEIPCDHLDARGTIAATLRHSGWLTPVFETRRVSPRYLILVDIDVGAHSMLDAVDYILDRWQRTGLEFTRYDYRSDPAEGLYPRGDLGVPGARHELVSLARRHFGARLIAFHRLNDLRNPETSLAWLGALDPWPRRVLLDLYPPSDDATHTERRRLCEGAGLRTFPLVGAGLRAAAAHLLGYPLPSSTRESLARDVPYLPPDDRTLMLWAAAAACVPDASWAQLEDIRRELLPGALEALAPGTPLPASFEVTRLIRWIEVSFQFEVTRSDGRTLRLNERIEAELLKKLRLAELDRPVEERLETRVRLRLIEQHGRALKGRSEKVRRFIQFKIDFHKAVLDAAAAARFVHNCPRGFAPECAALLGPELARQAGGLGVAMWSADTCARASDFIMVASEDVANTPITIPVFGGSEAWRWVAAAATIGVAGVTASTIVGNFLHPDRSQPSYRLPAIYELVMEPGPLPSPATAACPAGTIDAPPTGARDRAQDHNLNLGPGVQPMRFIALTGGEFTMGSPKDEPGHQSDETRHRVCLSPFEIAATEVTVDQYRALIGDSKFSGDTTIPMTEMSWEDSVRFANALTAHSNQFLAPDGRLTACYNESTWAWDRGCTGYRLPTEAEWEYAARAGTTTPWSFGKDEKDLCKHGNVADKRGNGQYDFSVFVDCDDGYAHPAPVGSFPANAWDLHDMHGNVWEWVYDRYDAGFYGKEGSTVINPVNTPEAARTLHVLRGGSFGLMPVTTRSASRFHYQSTGRGSDFGLRCVRGRVPNAAP